MSEETDYDNQVLVSRVLLDRAYEENVKIGPTTDAIDPHKRYDRRDSTDPLGRVIREYYAMGTAFYGK